MDDDWYDEDAGGDYGYTQILKAVRKMLLKAGHTGLLR